MDWGAKIVLVMHGICAVITAGAAVHNGLLSIKHLLGKDVSPRLMRLYPQIILWGFLGTFLMGLWIYPDFVVRVREPWLDQQMPMATALFEIKEHWLGIALALAFFSASRSRTMHFRGPAPDRGLYHLCAISLMLVVLYSAVLGMVLVSVRSV